MNPKLKLLIGEVAVIGTVVLLMILCNSYFPDFYKVVMFGVGGWQLGTWAGKLRPTIRKWSGVDK